MSLDHVDFIERLAAETLVADKYAELYPERTKDRARAILTDMPPYEFKDEKDALIDALESD